jgi:bifunctional non-homologous end joining protein LigD
MKRIRRAGDLFAPVLTLKQKLPVTFTKALAAGPPPKLSSWPRNRSKSGQNRDKSLREYAAKRDHARTPEPAARSVAGSGKKKGVHRFVIQKHAASHLHYDWRLRNAGRATVVGRAQRAADEAEGSPSRDARRRSPARLREFRRHHSPGNYGAGTVMVWDHGEYEELTGNPVAAFHQGKMHVILRGKKLKGEWILVKDRREEDSNKWLLIKAGTPLTLSAKADDTSAVSGRSMAKIAKDNDAQWQSNRPAEKRAKRGPIQSSHREAAVR